MIVSGNRNISNPVTYILKKRKVSITRTYKKCSYKKCCFGYKVMKNKTYFGNTGTAGTSLTAGNYILMVCTSVTSGTACV